MQTKYHKHNVTTTLNDTMHTHTLIFTRTMTQTHTMIHTMTYTNTHTLTQTRTMTHTYTNTHNDTYTHLHKYTPSQTMRYIQKQTLTNTLLQPHTMTHSSYIWDGKKLNYFCSFDLRHLVLIINDVIVPILFVFEKTLRSLKK